MKIAIETPPRRRTRAFLWTGVAVSGGGLALVGIGAGLYAVGKSAFDTLDHPQPGYTFNAADEDHAHLWRPAGTALIAVGGALVVAGVALIVIDRRHVRRQRAALQSGSAL